MQAQLKEAQAGLKEAHLQRQQQQQVYMCVCVLMLLSICVSSYHKQQLKAGLNEAALEVKLNLYIDRLTKEQKTNPLYREAN